MAKSPVGPLLVLLGVLVSSPASSDEPSPENKPVRLSIRADWTNPTSTIWSGSLRLSAGRFVSLQRIEMTPGQLRLLPGSPTEVHFQSAGPAPWSGLDLLIEGPADASIELAMDGHRLETRLAELYEGSPARMVWEGSARLRRNPDNILKITTKRPHLIFDPGERAQLDLEFNLLDAETRVLTTPIAIELRHARSLSSSSATRGELQVPTNRPEPLRQGIELVMPETEGAYDLVIRAEPAGMRPIERVMQFVVFDPRVNPKSDPDETMHLVQEIDPARPEASEAWYSTRRMFARTTRLGQFLWTSVRHPFGGGARAEESPVYLCRLNVEKPGVPHMLSIEYEESAPLLLAASVHERDSDRRWVAVPTASGVKSAGKGLGSVVETQQLVFWPRTKTPSLSLYVEGSLGVTAIKKIHLHEMPRYLPPLDVPEPDSDRRMFGLYLDHVDVWAGWGSARVSDSATGLTLDDWSTFLESSRHVADYARFSGYNCVMATVAANGGTMYPSDLLPQSLRLDSGSLAESAPDVLRKDVVELLLRICQRNQLGLVPTLRLDGPIPELDAKLASDPSAKGISLVSREGKVWNESGDTATPSAPRYNPIHPQVQQTLVRVLGELLDRYGHHAGLEAIALDLAAHTHLVLPNLDWGYDLQTVAQFSRESGVELPQGESEKDYAARYQVLMGPARDQWIAWRCRQMAKFYEKCLAEVEKARPGMRLVLALTTLSGAGTNELRDSLRQSRTVEDLLRSKGLDLRGWSAPPGVVVLRPFAATGLSPENLHMNSSREFEDLMARLPSKGAVCVHEPEVLHVAGEGSRGKEGETEPISVPVLPSGRASLRRFARGLAGSDAVAVFDGGPAVPLGQESVQQEFARVFRTLPAQSFKRMETEQPLVVRSHRGTRETIMYLVNDATYPVDANLVLDCPSQTTLTDAVTGEKIAVQPAERGISTRLSMKPLETIAFRMSSPEVVGAQYKVVLPTRVETGFQAKLQRIQQAMLVLDRDATRTLDGLLPNGDFEQASDEAEMPADWSTEGMATLVRLDTQILHSGQSSLRLSGMAGGAALSKSFKPPSGPALALNVWLRGERPNQRLRWFLIGRHGDQIVYRCFADVPLKTTWEQKQLRARDLPEAPLDSVEMKFQLLDDGTVWIDEARVCALAITNDEQKAIRKSVASIFSAWKDRRLSDFERLADGYWATVLVESVEGTENQTDATAAPVSE